MENEVGMEGEKKVIKKMTTAMRKRIMLVGVILLAVCVLVIGGSYFGLHSYVNRIDEDRIYEGIYIGDVNVSGMTVEEAEQALDERVEALSRKQLSLVVGEQSAEIPFGEFEIYIEDQSDLVQQAVNYAKEGSIWGRYWRIRELARENMVIEVVYGLNEEIVIALLKEHTDPLETEADNATISRENGEFVIVDETIGKVVDLEESKQVVIVYIKEQWDGQEGSVGMIVVVDEPEVTREQLETIQDKLGSFTTHVGTAGGGRVQNIQTGTGHINGNVVLPGEEHSSNAAMEPYTVENGYTTGGAFADGQVVQSMGGGICQVSSTLYNALLYAELEITQRNAHSMMVTYVQPSRDAAIAGYWSDLRFRNNLETPIFIEGYMADGDLTFNIFGKETRPENREIKFLSETLRTVGPTRRFVEASGSALGSISESGGGGTGQCAMLWKIVYVDGEEVSREEVNRSSYRAPAITVSVGTSSNHPEASAIVRAAIASQDMGAIQGAIARARELIRAAERPPAPPPAPPAPPEEPPREGGSGGSI